MMGRIDALPLKHKVGQMLTGLIFAVGASSPVLAVPGLNPSVTPSVVAPAPAAAQTDPTASRLQAAKQRIQTAKQLLQSGAAELASLQKQADTPTPQVALDALDLPALESLRQSVVLQEQEASDAVQTHTASLNALETQKPFEPAVMPPKPPATASAEQLAQAEALAQAINAENEAAALEINSRPLAIQLARARLQLAEKRANDARARLQAIDRQLDALRLQDARSALQDAPPAGRFDAYPPLQQFAQGNERLAQTLLKLTEALAELMRTREALNQRTLELREEMDTLQRQLDQFGFGPLMGRLLLEKRATLPVPDTLQNQRSENRDLLEMLQTVELHIVQERQQAHDPATFLAELKSSHAQDAVRLRSDVEQLIAARQTIFSRLEAIKSPTLQAIAGMEFAMQEQQRVVAQYRNFIARNLLWLPNEQPVWQHSLPVHLNGMGTTLSMLDLRGMAAALLDGVRSHLVPSVLFALAVLLLLLWRKRFHRRLQQMIERARDPDASLALGAAHSLLLVLLLALPAPLFFAGVGFLLHNADLPAQRVLADNLLQLVPVMLNMTLLLVILRPAGLVERMFAWNAKILSALRQAFRTLLYIGLPLELLASTHLDLSSLQRGESGGGQTFLILFLLLLSYVLWRLLRPSGVFIRTWRAIHPAHWLSRHAMVLFLAALAIPLSLASLAAFGYTYSAGVLTHTFSNVLWVMLALVLFNGFASMGLQRAYQRIAQQRQAREVVQGMLAEGEQGPHEPMNMDAIAMQSRKLLDFSLLLVFLVAIYFVWAPVLPAFSLLDQINLWNVNENVGGGVIQSAVSLGDVLFTALILLALWVAGRNLPGVMEIVLEQWTHHSPGTRYAITSILRYIIISAGIVILLGGLGVQWSQLQWLVAALGVGLGFGLQEIFANFISGIIILLERPVRVGDLITIGNQTGTIRRIHMRATVLEDFDRKEIILPNKQLITQAVTNWTLSDSSTRILVDVGVAYGADTRQVEKLLLAAAGEVPRLQTDPAPMVWFMGFGDSALNFRLRAFVDDADIKQSVTSELNYAVERILRENGIAIPFPQRDVHIPGLEELAATLKNNLGAAT